jgi:hypothetical protein
MKAFVCWKADDVYQIVNPDADAVSDHVFRAVHTDFAVRKRDQLDDAGVYVQPEEILKAFLSPRDHALVPVIGDSGTGKSHLIRWLQVRLGISPKREVIFVPKAGTNLRGIVTSLIQRLPESAREPYAAILKDAGGTVLNTLAQRTAVLSQLQLALVNDSGGPELLGDDKEQEEYLLSGLRGLFLDPYYREQHFLRDGKFASDIASHVFQRPDKYHPKEQRREFRRDDLPLDISKLNHAARSTQEFLPALLANNALADAAAKIVDRNLDWAISNCLNVTGDRLIELMLDLRRHIKESGKELVLLIEDFARLQGLDRALLQSLLEQRPDLCRLRTAFATTTGFFDSVAPTVRSRLTFVVDLDVPLGHAQGIPLPKIVSRYLNAVRWGAQEVRSQWDNVDGDDSQFEMPSACDDCSHKIPCHKSFGQIDGNGLYPFTELAIQTMAERADPNVLDRFNLRTFQRRVLRPVALGAGSIEGGQFPPYELLMELGGIKHFSSAEENRLRKLDPVNWRRRLSFLQLWADTSSVTDLDPLVHEAFALPILGVAHAAEPSDVTSPSAPARTPILPEVGSGDPRLHELDEWHRGQTKLSARTSQVLRELVFEAIKGYVDWDISGLAPSAFLGNSRPFQARSIYFENQVTNRAAVAISMTIPFKWDDDAERYRTVLALQGLIELSSNRTWAFKGGSEKLSALHACLALWSRFVVQEIAALDDAACGWRPAIAAFQLRSIAVALTKPDQPLRNKMDVYIAGFADVGSVPTYTNHKLSALVKELVSQDSLLRGAITARGKAMKGGDRNLTFVDSSMFSQAVGELRQKEFITSFKVPEDKALRIDELRALAKLAKRVDADLGPLLTEEIESRQRSLEEIGSAFGKDATQQHILKSVSSFLDGVGAFGIAGTKEVTYAKNAFEQVEFDVAIRSIKNLLSSDKLRIHEVAVDVTSALSSSKELIEKLGFAVDSAERELKNRLLTEGIDTEQRDTLKADIEKNLGIVVESLNGVTNADTN